jgi:hypothetical protein
MRTNLSILQFTVLLIAIFFAGCSTPVANIRHVLPAAVPISKELAKVEVKNFRVKAQGDDNFGSYVEEILHKNLIKSLPQAKETKNLSSSKSHTLTIEGLIFIEVNDVKSTREVRNWSPKTQQFSSLEIPTLVRNVQVEVHFVLIQDSQDSVTVELRRSYTSLGDPRVRGQLGLQRPDAPDRVPSKDTIIRELLAECTDSFCSIVEPLEVSVQIPLRSTLNSEGAAGLKAAEKGDYPSAVKHFAAATEKEPNDINLVFNLAVSAEAAGNLELALENYTKILTNPKNQDQIAQDGAKRVRRVLLRLSTPIK